jgi:hypothetical protein
MKNAKSSQPIEVKDPIGDRNAMQKAKRIQRKKEHPNSCPESFSELLSLKHADKP